MSFQNVEKGRLVPIYVQIVVQQHIPTVRNVGPVDRVKEGKNLPGGEIDLLPDAHEAEQEEQPETSYGPFSFSRG